MGASSGIVEERFIFDTVFGINALNKSGIPMENIRILIDSQGQDALRQKLSSLLGIENVELCGTISLERLLLEEKNYKSLVFFINGHGNHECLMAEIPIKPSVLIKYIKNATHFERAVVYLGQCFAGIFNYQPVAKIDNEGCDIVIVGATNLSASISISTSENFGLERVSWVANLFLMGLFVWFQHPIDIDGDDRLTVADSYKFAGSYVNRALHTGNKNTFPNLLVDLVQAVTKYKNLTIEKNRKKFYVGGVELVDLPIELEQKAMREKIDNLSSQVAILLNRQEAWILNAIPAQQIEY
ncbi:MAG TPA: hypothetical protein GXZ38_00125 [Spirochaetales bacterium]|nr:hypothetical protein [Spirochaetales bacterium]